MIEKNQREYKGERINRKKWIGVKQNWKNTFTMTMLRN